MFTGELLGFCPHCRVLYQKWFNWLNKTLKRNPCFKQGFFLSLQLCRLSLRMTLRCGMTLLKIYLIIIPTSPPCVIDGQNSHSAFKIFPPVDGIHFSKLWFWGGLWLALIDQMQKEWHNYASSDSTLPFSLRTLGPPWRQGKNSLLSVRDEWKRTNLPQPF